MPQEQKPTNSKHKIYLGLTTAGMSDWREKIDEIKSLGLKEIAVFPTSLKKDERWELYRTLLNSSINYIPFVHLRHDSEIEEVAFFAKNFKTKLFNVHPIESDNGLFKRFPNRRKQLFIENAGRITPTFFKAIEASAGICLDISHWADYGVMQKESGYRDFEKVLNNYPVGFAHLTSVRKKPFYRDYGEFGAHLWHHSAHLMEKVSDFDYLKKYLDYLPEIMGIELENNLHEQLEAKKYIEGLL